MPQSKKLEAREKIRIIRDQLAGKYSIKEAAQRAGGSRTTFHGWKTVYEAEGILVTEMTSRWFSKPLTVR